MMPLHYMRHVQIEDLCRASPQVATKLVLKGTWADTESTFKATRHARQTATCIIVLVTVHRSHFGSRYKLGCCGHAGLLGASSSPVTTISLPRSLLPLNTLW
jgi:hypothetical protein